MEAIDPDPTDREIEDASKLAQQFYAYHILSELTDRKVRLIEDIERDEITIEAGSEGVIQPPFMFDGKLVAAIKLDEPPEGLEEYEGEIHWIEDDTLMDFEEQIELL